MRVRRAILLLFLAFAAVVAWARPDQARDPIVVLVSFDGWRWDYLDRFAAPHLQALASRGVRARELIPVFPTLTFPNHYTLVTGLYPVHHGIVANTIVDPGYPQRFTMSADTAKDARWWGGEPIWVTAVTQGRVAGAMFWPGAEAPIRGVRPTYWRPFDDDYPNDDRVDTVLGWLALPPPQQPALITLYFSDVDHAGHDAGPDSAAVQQAAARVDAALGRLLEGIRRQGLDDRVNIVIVSDHGMAALSEERRIFLDDYIDLSTIDVVDWDALLQIVPRPGTTDEVYERLHRRIPHVGIYRKSEVPERLRYRDHPRITPIVGTADVGWIVTSHTREQRRRDTGLRPRAGGHGYDPGAREMHGLFVAAGPAIRQGLVVEPFQNIHVYEFLCAILKLKPAKNDGDPDVTRRFLAQSR